MWFKGHRAHNRRPNLVGDGAFSRVFGRNVSGKEIVIKRVKARLPAKTAARIARWHNLYVSSLKEIGLCLPQTELRIYPKGKDRAIISIFQERFSQDEVFSNILESTTRKQALSAFEFVSGYCAGIIKNAWNLQKDKKICVGLDFSPGNIVIRNSKIFIADTFFPFIKIREKSSVEDITPFLGGLGMQIAAPLIKGTINAILFKPETRFIALLIKATRIRPELKKEFEKIWRKTIDEKFSEDERKTIEKSLSPGKITLLRVSAKFSKRLFAK